MKSLFTKYVWLQLILAILLIFGGSLIVAFAISGKHDVLQEGLNLVAAVTLFIFGFFAILTAFIFESRKALTTGLLYGSACIALGVFLCLRRFYLLDYIVLILAIFFIVIGVVEIGKGIILLTRQFRNVSLAVILLIVGILFVTLGIISIIYRENMKNVFCILAGVLLLAAGAFELVMGIRGLVALNKKGGKRTRKSANKEQPKEEVKELDYTSKN